MARNRFGALACAATLTLAACGGDGDSATSGTCDWTQVETRRTCLEQSGSPQNIANQRAACAKYAGVWGDAPCPVTAELIGCCAYEWGLQFRECFYERTGGTFDPENACTSAPIYGVWTPAQ